MNADHKSSCSFISHCTKPLKQRHVSVLIDWQQQSNGIYIYIYKYIYQKQLRMIQWPSYILSHICTAIVNNDNYYDDDNNKPTDNTNRQTLWKSAHLTSAIHYYNTLINTVNITKPTCCSSVCASTTCVNQMNTYPTMPLHIYGCNCELLPCICWISYNSVKCRYYFVKAPNQWRMMLHCNIVSHSLGAYSKWSLKMHM